MKIDLEIPNDLWDDIQPFLDDPCDIDEFIIWELDKRVRDMKIEKSRADFKRELRSNPLLHKILEKKA